jgi:hypothetical protein
MLTLCARWGWVVSTMPWPLYTMCRAPVSIVEEARWASGPVWTCIEKRKYLTSTGVRTPDRPTHRKSLHRLCHPTARHRHYDQHFTGNYLLLQVFSNIQTSHGSQGKCIPSKCYYLATKLHSKRQLLSKSMLRRCQCSFNPFIYTVRMRNDL